MNVLYFFTLIFCVLSVRPSYASVMSIEDGGCHHFCEREATKDTKNNGDDFEELYSVCMEKTATEGFCGKKPPETPRAENENTPPLPQERPAPPCEETYQRLVQTCDSSVTSASSGCDMEKNPQMNSVSSMVAQVALSLGKSTSSSIQASCSKMAAVSQAASGALVGFRTTCSSSISSCSSACGEVIAFVKSNGTCFTGAGNTEAGRMNAASALANAETSAKRCQEFSVNMSDANEAVRNFAATTANATQCEDQTFGGAMPPGFCEANPMAVGCANAALANCSDPIQAKTNKVCVCSTNPYDPICQGAQSANNSSQGGGGFIDSASRLGGTGASGGGGDVDFSSMMPSMTHAPLGPGGAGEAVDGRQGSGSPVSGGSGGGGGKPFKAAASGGAEDDAMTGGFGGGRGYGSGNLNKPSGAGGHGSAERVGGVATSSESPNAKNTDLRRFLPGGSYDPKNRGLAGSSGPDGITGPHSDIWQKIQNRYRVMSPTLLP